MKARTSDEQRKFEFQLGAIGILITIVALAAAVATAFLPFGETIYRADFNNSGGARPGDEVRVAGIRLGKIRDLTLVDDHVEVEFGLDKNVTLGDATRLEIKLLTPIGGRFMDVTPGGEGTSAGAIIPRERTKTPYDLSDALESTSKLASVDAETLRKSFESLAGAFTEQPVALNQILDNVNKLSEILTARKGQMEQALKVSTEYVEAALSNTDKLSAMGAQVFDIYRMVAQRREEVVTVINQIRRVFDLIRRPIELYGELLEPTLQVSYEMMDRGLAELLAHKDELDRLSKDLEPFIAWLAENTKDGTISIDDSGATVTDTRLCPTGTPGC